MWITLQNQARLLTPKLLAILLILLTLQPNRIPGMAHFMPMVEVMVIFYWSIYFPSLFPQWFVALLGIFQDVLYGAPLGITSLSNVLLRGTVVAQRKLFIKEPFIVVWFGFIIASFGVSLLKWLVTSAVIRILLLPDFVLMQWIFSISIYPWIHWLLNKTHKYLPNDA